MAKKNKTFTIKATGTNTISVECGKSHSFTTVSYDMDLKWSDVKKVAKKVIKDGMDFESFLIRIGADHLQNEKLCAKLQKKFNKLQKKHDENFYEREGEKQKAENCADINERLEDMRYEELRKELDSIRKMAENQSLDRTRMMLDEFEARIYNRNNNTSCSDDNTTPYSNNGIQKKC